MGSRFFGRAVKVVIVDPRAPAIPIPVVSALDYAPLPASALTDDAFTAATLGAPGTPSAQTPQPAPFAKAFSGLHVSFKAEKNLLGTPNTLELSIYNLAAATRKQLQSAGMFVELYAGYQSDLANLPLIFRGTTRTIDHVRVGPDWVTRIRSGDGDQGYRFGQAAASFQPGTTALAVAQYLAGKIKAADPLRIDTTAFLATAPKIVFPKPAYVHGHAVSGSAFKALAGMLGDKYELSFQDGGLLALALRQAKPQTATIPLISPATGMIGSPDHGDPNLDGLPSVLKVQTLLRGTILPGDLVQLESAATSGTFKVQKLAHVGNTAGNEWQTDLELYDLTQAPL